MQNLKEQFKSKFIFISLKLLVTFLLLTWVLGSIDSETLVGRFETADYRFILLAIFAHIVAYLLLSVRWWVLLRIPHNTCKFQNTIGSYYLGLFFNNFLPTGLGGDVVRILRLRKTGIRLSSLVTSTFMDRVIGLASIVTMGCIAILFFEKLQLGNQMYYLIFLVALIFSTGIFLFHIETFWHAVNKFLTVRSTIRIFHYLHKVVMAFSEYRKNNSKLFISLLLSFIAQTFVILCYFLIGRGLAIDVPVTLYFSIIPIVFLLSSLPISIGGLGVREGAMVSLLSLFSVDTQAAIALSLIYFCVIVIITLPAAFVILRRVSPES